MLCLCRAFCYKPSSTLPEETQPEPQRKHSFKVVASCMKHKNCSIERVTFAAGAIVLKHNFGSLERWFWAGYDFLLPKSWRVWRRMIWRNTLQPPQWNANENQTMSLAASSFCVPFGLPLSSWIYIFFKKGEFYYWQRNSESPYSRSKLIRHPGLFRSS